MMRFETRLILIYIIILVLFSSIFFMISVYYYNRALVQNIDQMDRDQFNFYSQQINEKISKLNHLMLQLKFNSSINIYAQNSFYSKSPREYFSLHAEDISNLLLENQAALDLKVNRLALYTADGAGIVIGANYREEDMMRDVKEISQMMIKKQNFSPNEVTVSMISDNDPWSARDSGAKQAILRMIVPLSGSWSAIYGYAEVQIPLSRLCDNLLSAETVTYKSLYLMINDNNVVYMTGAITDHYQKLIDQTLQAHANDILIASASDVDYSCHLLALDQTKMNLAMISQKDILYQPLRTLIILLIGAYLLAIGLSVIMIRMLVFRVTKPLQILAATMDQVTIKALKPAADNHIETDIIRNLYGSYNRMIVRVDESKQQLIEAETREIKAVFGALQSQINPHFFCNTLSMIAMLAYENKQTQIYEISMKMIALFRYTTQIENNAVILEDELEYTRHYLSLLQIRYEDSLTYQIEVAPELMTVRVPKILLQPFIENSIKHGFTEKRGNWEILITVQGTPDHWEILIRDNGTGIPAPTLQAIQNDIELLRQSRQANLVAGAEKIGVINTFLRFKIMNGDRSVMDIQSDSGGTVIRLGVRNEIN